MTAVSRSSPVPAQQRPGDAADDVEQRVRKVAQFVLGATSLADRLERMGPDLSDAAADRADRVALLRAVAERGRWALQQQVTGQGAVGG